MCTHNEKMVEPQYQELLNKDIPHVNKGGVNVAVIAGTSYGASVSLKALFLFPDAYPNKDLNQLAKK